MVRPWFVHRFDVFDGGTMEEPWSNHGRTTFEFRLGQVDFYAEIEPYSEK
ncbi:MAG: hypothetical protein ACPGSG_04380 [Prolixibacteraceae bacterium]